MKVIAIFNQSGGVAKTTVAMNLGYQLSQKGARVLLVDSDPQATLTVFCGLEPHKLANEETLYGSIVGDAALPICRVWDAINLVPSNINLAATDIELFQDGMRDVRLKDALAPHSRNYDVVLIDLPPSLSLISRMSLVSAQAILIPIETEYKSWAATSLVLETIGAVRKRSNKNLEVFGFVPTRYDQRLAQHKECLEAMHEQLAHIAPVFTPIPNRTDFPKASKEHLPLLLFNRRSDAIAPIDEIADCVLNSIKVVIRG